MSSVLVSVDHEYDMCETCVSTCIVMRIHMSIRTHKASSTWAECQQWWQSHLMVHMNESSAGVIDCISSEYEQNWGVLQWCSCSINQVLLGGEYGLCDTIIPDAFSWQSTRDRWGYTTPTHHQLGLRANSQDKSSLNCIWFLVSVSSIHRSTC